MFTVRYGSVRTWALLAGLVAPAVGGADGGAPMLLFAGPAVFLVGQVWIVASELLVLRWVVRNLGWGDAFRDVVAANMKSLLVVGLLLPACVSAAGWVLAVALGSGFHTAGLERESAMLATWSFVLTGWFFDGEWVRRMFPYQFVMWFAVSYVLSVVVEARVLARRWEARGGVAGVNVSRTSMVINAVSYAGMAVVLTVLALRYLHW